MAKGQVRSNREARKPKKDKTAPVPPTAAGTQVKSAAGSAAGFPKK